MINKNELLSYLAKKQSKQLTIFLATEIAKSEVLEDLFFEIFTSENDVIKKRAAWVMSYFFDLNPIAVKKRLSILIQIINQQNLHDAIYRNAIRVLLKYMPDNENKGIILNFAFQAIINPNCKPSIQSSCIKWVIKYFAFEKEILNELKLTLEQFMPYRSIAFHCSANKALEYIRKNEKSYIKKR